MSLTPPCSLGCASPFAKKARELLDACFFKGKSLVWNVYRIGKPLNCVSDAPGRQVLDKSSGSMQIHLSSVWNYVVDESPHSYSVLTWSSFFRWCNRLATLYVELLYRFAMECAWSEPLTGSLRPVEELAKFYSLILSEKT